MSCETSRSGGLEGASGGIGTADSPGLGRRAILKSLLGVGVGGPLAACGGGEVDVASPTDARREASLGVAVQPLGSGPESSAALAPQAADASGAPPWYVDVNPERPFESPQGTIPAGVAGKSGLANVVVASVETVKDDLTREFVLSRTFANVTPTEVQLGVVTPTFPILERVRDPGDGNKWAYYHRINKQEVGIDGVKITPENVPDSYRSEVASAGKTRWTPTGTEEWAVCGIRLPAYWRIIDTRGEWHVFFQYHDSERGLTANPPIAIGWTGGNGNPANCRFEWVVRRYNNPDWPTRRTRGNTTVYQASVANPAADTWHWFVFNYRSGCGFRDPVKGAIYGPTNPADCFVTLYHAVEDGAPDRVGSHVGFWGSPYLPSDPRVQALQPGQPFPCNGFWRNGVYLDSNFRPASAGDNRDAFSKGHRVYRASDSPGMTAYDVLRDFRGV